MRCSLAQYLDLVGRKGVGRWYRGSGWCFFITFNLIYLINLHFSINFHFYESASIGQENLHEVQNRS